MSLPPTPPALLRRIPARLALLLSLALCALAPARAEVLYRFTFPVGVGPAALVHGADGNLYGATQRGGAFGHGGLFRVRTGQPAEALYSFGAIDHDGDYPTSLIESRHDAIGTNILHFYGTTRVGGAFSRGTVFSLTVDAGGATETVLYSFRKTLPADCSNPAALMQAHDDSLIGAAPHGGRFGYGGLFQLTTAGARYGLLHEFTSADGAMPMTAPTEDADDFGKFYGVTRQGGKTGNGTVYKFTESDGRLSTLHSFAAPDGYFPSTRLVQDTTSGTHDRFYGATASDATTGAGTLFEVSTTGQLITTHFFDFDTEGGSPSVLLLSGTRLYGATAAGGANPVHIAAGGSGVVFQATFGGDITPLYSFPHAKGSSPAALLMAGGTLYGAAHAGGLYSSGIVFSLPTERGKGGGLQTLHSFSAPDGTHPVASLVQGSDGYLYGSTSTDGTPPPEAGTRTLRSGTGTLFRLVPDASSATGFSVTTLHSFVALLSDTNIKGAGTNGAGAFPQSALTEDHNSPGTFYGVTEYGGAHATGTVFRFVPGALEASSVLNTVHEFGAVDANTANDEGAYPAAPLLQQGRDFYGTALYGGAQGNGTVYRVATDRSGVSAILPFKFTEGAYPAAGLVADRQGVLYGTTGGGGQSGYGTVFSLTTGGAFHTLHSFAFTDGAAPQAALALAQDSAGEDILCGTTFYGGSFGFGTTFQQVTTDADFNTLHSFTDADEGGNPEAALLVIPFGALTGQGSGTSGIHIGGYRTAGAAFTGGGGSSAQAARQAAALSFLRRHPALPHVPEQAGNPGVPESMASSGGVTTQAVSSGSAPPSGGTVFVQSADGTNTRAVISFGGQDGSNPAGPLVKASDGYYYGTTEYGGAGAGTIYRVALPLVDDAAPKSPAAGRDVSLTVAGSGFVKGLQVLWNGTALVTTVKSPGLLTAKVPASVNTAGVVNLTVNAPDGSKHVSSNSYKLRSLPNDNFADRILLSGKSVTATGSNVGATFEAGEPYRDGNFSTGHSVWWSWTAPASGTVTMDTAGSEIFGLLSVYTGSAVNALTAVPYSYDNYSVVQFAARQGVTYQISVDDEQGDTGSIVLHISQ